MTATSYSPIREAAVRLARKVTKDRQRLPDVADAIERELRLELARSGAHEPDGCAPDTGCPCYEAGLEAERRPVGR